MINWSHQEEGFCEGTFESSFFHDEDEYGNEFSVCVKSPDLIQCAEKCVEAFNHLTESDHSMSRAFQIYFLTEVLRLKRGKL